MAGELIESVGNPSVRAWLASIRHETAEEERVRLRPDESAGGDMLSACCRALCPCLDRPTGGPLNEETRVTYDALNETPKAYETLNQSSGKGETDDVFQTPQSTLPRPRFKASQNLCNIAESKNSSFLSLHFAHETTLCFPSSELVRLFEVRPPRRHSTPADKKEYLEDEEDSIYRLTWPLKEQEDREKQLAEQRAREDKRSGWLIACCDQIDLQFDQVVCSQLKPGRPRPIGSREMEELKDSIVEEVSKVVLKFYSVRVR